MADEKDIKKALDSIDLQSVSDASSASSAAPAADVQLQNAADDGASQDIVVAAPAALPVDEKIKHSPQSISKDNKISDPKVSKTATQYYYNSTTTIPGSNGYSPVYSDDYSIQNGPNSATNINMKVINDPAPGTGYWNNFLYGARYGSAVATGGKGFRKHNERTSRRVSEYLIGYEEEASYARHLYITFYGPDPKYADDLTRLADLIQSNTEVAMSLQKLQQDFVCVAGLNITMTAEEVQEVPDTPAIQGAPSVDSLEEGDGNQGSSSVPQVTKPEVKPRTNIANIRLFRSPGHRGNNVFFDNPNYVFLLKQVKLIGKHTYYPLRAVFEFKSSTGVVLCKFELDEINKISIITTKSNRGGVKDSEIGNTASHKKRYEKPNFKNVKELGLSLGLSLNGKLCVTMQKNEKDQVNIVRDQVYTKALEGLQNNNPLNTSNISASNISLG